MSRAHHASLRGWPSRGLLLVLLLLLGAGCRPTRPDFDIDVAHREIAAAFAREPKALAILGDSRGSAPNTWVVDFTVDGFDPFLQAKFEGTDVGWSFAGVRERPAGSKETPWIAVGVMLGRFRGEITRNAEVTQERIAELATFVERYAVEHGGRYPGTTIDGLRQLVVDGRYIEDAKWRHSSDGWGGAFAYHGASDGNAYIIVSPGADGRWDLPLTTYYENSDQGLEIYGGATSDPNRDIIWASGALVQSYRPD